MTVIRIMCTLKYKELNKEPAYNVPNGRLVIKSL